MEGCLVVGDVLADRGRPSRPSLPHGLEVDRCGIFQSALITQNRRLPLRAWDDSATSGNRRSLKRMPDCSPINFFVLHPLPPMFRAWGVGAGGFERWASLLCVANSLFSKLIFRFFPSKGISGGVFFGSMKFQGQGLPIREGFGSCYPSGGSINTWGIIVMLAKKTRQRP